MAAWNWTQYTKPERTRLISEGLMEPLSWSKEHSCPGTPRGRYALRVSTSDPMELADLAGGEAVLVVNAGSSSLKMQLVPQRLHVLIERIGDVNGAAARNHSEAFRVALTRLRQQAPGVRLVACGHRVVHGGEEFREPTLINPQVIDTVARLSRIAPLHNPAGLAGMEAALEELPDIPHVAVFDTAFHATLPPESYVTGLPYEYYTEQGIRNYGFHGTNHDHVTRRAATLLGRPRTDLRIVSLHLGNGASAAAVMHGRSHDTSMGFTPLAGLLMGTRTGDLDPGILLHLLREGMKPDELDRLLNRESGLKGISGRSNDMRDLRQAAEDGDERARLAISVYVKRVKKAVGALTAAMDGLDALVFTGGIGENDVLIREEILNGMEWLGVRLDEARNRSGGPLVSAADSKVKVLVITADEEGLIAAQSLSVAKREAAAW